MGWSWTIFLSSDAIFRNHKISQSQVKGLPKNIYNNTQNMTHPGNKRNHLFVLKNSYWNS